MPVPDFQQVMLPLMQIVADGHEHTSFDVMEDLSKVFQLSQEDLDDRIPSGLQTRFYNRVTWATTHLKEAGLVERTRRGFFQITERGQQLLANSPPKIDLNLLGGYPEYVAFRNRRRLPADRSAAPVAIPSQSQTPEELLDDSYRTIRLKVANELLEKVKSCTPSFFENLVVHLLVRMGYGGTIEDAGRAVGRSGDGGIDGIIKEDRLGLDLIYLQAKRWEGNVSRPEIQKFAGALMGNRSRKGVFITTSDFSKEARDYVKSIDSTIILIDGTNLSELMIDFNVGVSVVSAYEIKKIDSDFFED